MKIILLVKTIIITDIFLKQLDKPFQHNQIFHQPNAQGSMLSKTGNLTYIQKTNFHNIQQCLIMLDS